VAGVRIDEADGFRGRLKATRWKPPPTGSSDVAGLSSVRSAISRLADSLAGSTGVKADESERAVRPLASGGFRAK